MRLLRMPARQPDYRQQREHGDFVKGLAESIPSARPDEFVDELVRAASGSFDLQPATLDEAMHVLRMPHRQVTQLLE